MPDTWGYAKDKLSPVEAELVKIVLSMPPEQQRDLLAELKARRSSARRKFSRRPYFHSVQFSAGGKLFNGFIKDVSDGGAFVEILKSDLGRLEKGQHITLSFEHPYNSRYIKRSGEIARTSDAGIGIRFDQML